MLPERTPQSSDDRDEKRAFLQARVALFWKVLFFFMLGASLLGSISAFKSIGADLLPMAGQGIPPTGVDILGSQMAELIKNVGESYAMVIVDLPPLRPVADALAMSAMLNGVIVVAEWDKTPLPDLTETIHSLRIARVGVIGIILTKVSPRAQQGFARRLDYRYEY